MKKGDVNWQMVMMILAMIVLVVLLFVFRDIIFSSKTNLDNMNSCEGRGGKVITDSDKKCDADSIQIFPSHYIKKECNPEKNEEPKKDCKCCISQDKYIKE